MEVDQINRGNLVATINGYAIDLFKVTNSGAAVLASQQVVDAPPGLSNSLKVSVTTSNASPGSADFCYISTALEGFRVQRLLFGNAVATTLAVGFWVKTFRAGIYGVNISNAAGNRGYSAPFTVAASGVWQWVAVAVPGDVTGTWPTNNVKSLVITWAMMAGSGLQMTPNSWTAGGQQGVSGQVNGAQSVSDTMQITGVSAFPGYVVPSAARSVGLCSPFAEARIQCMRYWQKSYNYEVALATSTNVGANVFSSYGTTGSVMEVPVRFPVSMMTAPSMTIYSTTGASGKVRDLAGVQFASGSTASDVTATLVNTPGQTGFSVEATGATAAWVEIGFHFQADARM